MTIPVLICDDSSLARKQMARALPGGWDISVSFANNGHEALDAIRAGKGDILFLDLNMPVMDGYEVLQRIRDEDLPTMVLVVSGDVQLQAHKRVKSLGALDFIRKPASTDKIAEILTQYGIISHPRPQSDDELARFEMGDIALTDLMQEVVNVAMGQAGSLLGEVLNTFVKLPVPNVVIDYYAALKERIAARNFISLSGVSEGFNGDGLTGEAILLIDKHSFSRMFELFQHDDELRQVSDLEVLMDLSSVLIGACLQSITKQLDVELSYSHPVVLGSKKSLGELLGSNADEQKILAVEINFSLPEHDVECELIIAFTEQSIPALTQRAGYLR
jgi:CheY-like chemotaxis protein